MPKRVLQVAARTFTLANFALPLMERLRENGFEAEAFGPRDGFEERLQTKGFEVHPWTMGHTFSPLGLLGARRELRRFLQAHRYDIVHVHCSFGGIIGNPVACRETGALLYTQHGFYVHEGPDPVRRWAWLRIERIGLRDPHRVICISQAERELALTLGVGGEAKFVAVPGAGVRTESFRLAESERQSKRHAVRTSLSVGEGETVLLTLSRLTWDKGYRDLIGMARRLKAQGLRFRLLAAGSGKDEIAIRRAVREADVEEVVSLLGWRDDVIDLYCAADVFVFASYREGLPIAPLEAMASGLPVVASDLPGCREEIEHERSGLLYPVRNVAALTEAVMRVVGDQRLAANLGGEARERARQFDLERVLDLQLQLYHEVAERL